MPLVTITRVSAYSGISRNMELEVTEDQLAMYRAGILIQDAFPNLTADQREFIKTGITAEEWDSLFPEEEDME